MCEVVYQPYQFSWTITHAPAYDSASWADAMAVLTGSTSDPTGGSTHYHADYVEPWWAEHYVLVRIIGHHLFYR